MAGKWETRKSPRLRGYDYGQANVFFVTICTENRACLLSRVCRGGVLPLPVGEIVQREIEALPQRFPVEIHKFVVMPNHVHLLMSFRASKREGQSPSPTLYDVIGAWKSVTTKKANAFENTVGRKLWQRSFHDHIIRNEKDFLAIWKYIEENPLKWELDCFYAQQNEQIEISE